MTFMRFLVLIILPFILAANISYSQCCSAGNPLDNNADYIRIEKNNMKINITYNHSYSNTYYHENEPFTLGFIEEAYFNFSEISLTYGVFNRLNIKTDVGYFYNKTEKYNLTGIPASVGFGIGDASFQARYLIYKSFTNKWELNGGLGLKLPVGVFDQEVNNIKLPITVQPSSGSYKTFANLFFVKSIEDKFRFFTYGNMEISKKITSENFEYKYGNAYILAIGSNYSISKNINTSLQLRSEIRAKAQRENNQIVESSGGKIFYAVPGISLKLFCKYYLYTTFNLPVYKYLNGIQLSNNFSFSLSITRYLDFNQTINQ